MASGPSAAGPSGLAAAAKPTNKQALEAALALSAQEAGVHPADDPKGKGKAVQIPPNLQQHQQAALNKAYVQGNQVCTVHSLDALIIDSYTYKLSVFIH